MSSSAITKQIVKQIPTGFIVGAVCAFVVIGIVYSAWEESSPEKSNEGDAKSNKRKDSIATKKEELFARIVG